MEPRTDQHPWHDFDLVQRAASYAAEAHRDDLRKGTAIPYLSHLWAVAALVLDHGGDDVQVAAALLHDVVEDHGGVERLQDVRACFGDEVARLVEALSDSVVDTSAGQQKPEWKQRKASYLEHLAEADGRVQRISACDKLHNARSILADYRAQGPDVWARFNAQDPADQLWYYQRLTETLAAGAIPQALADELKRTVEELTELVLEDDPAVADRIYGPRSTCPTCGQAGTPILYGYPSPGMADAAERGDIQLGGCVIEDDMPTHECAARHQWRVITN